MTDISVTYMGYHCIECGRKFADSQDFQNHVQKHQKKQQHYVCQDCGKTFKAEFWYKSHRLDDKGEYTLECEVCGQLFSNGTCLDTHYKTHASEKFYMCKICGKTYKQLGKLRKHLSAHPEKIPCNDCGTYCSSTRSFEKHYIKHHLHKPYACTDCGQGFGHHFNLEIHRSLCTVSDPNAKKYNNESPDSVSFSPELSRGESASPVPCDKIEVEEGRGDCDFDSRLPLEVCINEVDEVLST